MQKLAVISAIVITLNACAPAMPGLSYAPPRMTPMIEVHNDSATEAAIYLVRGSLSLRLGTVGAQSRTLLPLPIGYSNSSGLVFEARAFALDESYTSPDMVVDAGNRVILRLLNPLPTASHIFNGPWR